MPDIARVLKEEIVRLADVVIGSRETDGKAAASALPPLIAGGYQPMETLRVSSSEIREKLASRQDCSSLLPPQVYRYIKKHHLYEEVDPLPFKW